jgi:proline dehydrogenase
MMRSLLLDLSKNQRARRFVTHAAVSRRAVRRFVAGETLEEALRVVADLNGRGLVAALDVLGEATTSVADARRAARAYEETLIAIRDRGLHSHVSVKLSQLGLDITMALAEELLAAVATRARETGSCVEVDMEDSARLPFIQQVLDRVWDQGARDMLLALQAALYRTPGDLERYLARGIGIRLCKGAYAESPRVAHARKADVDRAFAGLAERLIVAGGRSAIATHDERLIAHVRAVAAARGVPPAAVEFQLLFGIRRDLQDMLARQGYRVRVYVPYGTHWYPYFMRRLAERPANVLFLARHLIRA